MIDAAIPALERQPTLQVLRITGTRLRLYTGAYLLGTCQCVPGAPVATAGQGHLGLPANATTESQPEALEQLEVSLVAHWFATRIEAHAQV